ncbi:MAG TPA: MBL fold metallo-hydrolase [Bacillales bacterium]|nr:MBL fold metallo-hydrolase [Bacillales bacterium]
MIEISTHDGVTCVRGRTPSKNITNVVYVFLFDGMLVDTASRNLQNDLIPFYQSNRFDQVVLTHTHEDHIGTASWIENHAEVPLYVHPDSVDDCKQPPNYPKYRQLAWGIYEPFSAFPLGNTVESRNHTWQVIETPGHAKDHVVLLNKETGRLFSGDLFLTPKPKAIMKSESIPPLMESIRNVLRYDFRSMYCNHAGYLPEGKKMLNMKLQYLEDVSGNILRLHEKGYTIPEINKTLFPKVYPIIETSDHEFDSEHIVRSVIEGHS